MLATRQKKIIISLLDKERASTSHTLWLKVSEINTTVKTDNSLCSSKTEYTCSWGNITASGLSSFISYAKDATIQKISDLQWPSGTSLRSTPKTMRASSYSKILTLSNDFLLRPLMARHPALSQALTLPQHDASDDLSDSSFYDTEVSSDADSSTLPNYSSGLLCQIMPKQGCNI